MLYIDDKARGVHEGYLVTPITRLELVLGLNLAGAIKARALGHQSHRHRYAARRPRHHF
jgi:ABC-2 type transport system permease protein